MKEKLIKRLEEVFSVKLNQNSNVHHMIDSHYPSQVNILAGNDIAMIFQSKAEMDLFLSDDAAAKEFTSYHVDKVLFDGDMMPILDRVSLSIFHQVFAPVYFGENNELFAWKKQDMPYFLFEDKQQINPRDLKKNGIDLRIINAFLACRREKGSMQIVEDNGPEQSIKFHVPSMELRIIKPDAGDSLYYVEKESLSDTVKRLYIGIVTIDNGNKKHLKEIYDLDSSSGNLQIYKRETNREKFSWVDHIGSILDMEKNPNNKHNWKYLGEGNFPTLDPATGHTITASGVRYLEVHGSFFPLHPSYKEGRV